MIRTHFIVLISINLFYLAFAQDAIEGRWHLVGYEDNVMYQFENNYRYSIYSIDGTFGDLDDAGGTPNPYTVLESIITIDLFFGNIVSYQMIFHCDGQIVVSGKTQSIENLKEILTKKKKKGINLPEKNLTKNVRIWKKKNRIKLNNWNRHVRN